MNLYENMDHLICKEEKLKSYREICSLEVQVFVDVWRSESIDSRSYFINTIL